MIGNVEEQEWTTVAHEIDGVPLPKPELEVRIQRTAVFAYNAEAHAWLSAQEAEGFEGDAYVSAYATSYFGPTDSPSNAWFASTEKRKDA